MWWISIARQPSSDRRFLPVHHPVFARFVPWRGLVDPTWDVNFLGVRTRLAFTAGMGGDAPTASRLVETEYPVFGEEYFEWIDVLEAVLTAERQFTMVELGAGWGRWLINAAAAARRCGVSTLCLVGVEAEPTHYRWMQQHFADNGIGSESCRLVEAAVAATQKRVRFHVGDPSAWYGQAIELNPRSVLGRIPFLSGGGVAKRTIRKVRAVALSQIVSDLNEIDLIDADLQGVEADVFESAEALLAQKVKRVHIGTHSSENERRLRVLFGALGWENLNDYASGTEVDTPWGRIKFQDGVQTWRKSSAPTRST
jgi:FkbM family methyltransferase